MTGATGAKGDTGAQGLPGEPAPVGPVYHIGDAGPDGGIVFFVDGSGQHGLEAQASNTGVLIWSAAISASAAYNTTPITTALSCSTTNAQLTPNCWHLPSNIELIYLLEQKAVVGGFGDNYWIWGSTVYEVDNMLLQVFYGGNQYLFAKDRTLPVRAVRAF